MNQSLDRQISNTLSADTENADVQWTQLLQATSCEAAAQPWLTLTCADINHIDAGILLLGELQSQSPPAAQWPEEILVSRSLLQLAEVARESGKGTIRKIDKGTLIAYPIKLDDTVYGAVCLSMNTVDMVFIRAAMRQLQWGCAWLRDIVRREHSLGVQGQHQFTQLALDIIGDVIEAEGASAAEHDLVHHLVSEFSLERACLGFLDNGALNITTISHSASFGEEMNLVRLLGEAMEEAIEQYTIIHYPMDDSDIPTLVRAHESLHLANRTGVILTVPLLKKGEPIGALLCECSREKTLAPAHIDLISGIAAYAGGLLFEKRQNDKSLIGKIRDSALRQYERMVGRGYTGRKLTVLGLAALVLFFTFAQGEYQVKADGVLKGEIQRSMVTPFDGFILSSPVRAGDRVKQGDLLVAFDDKDLVLERLNWVSQKQEYLFEYNRALGSRKRAEVNIFEARIAQADIQLELLDQQLQRTQLTAPFDGLVVSGDLSQSIGSSSRRGDILFEIAPLEAYRLTLSVDESQIADVEVGQKGIFLTGSLPDSPFNFSVTKITPVAKAVDGETVFEIEATVTDPVDVLRPGMEGLGKIDSGQRNLLWIWTRSLTHRLRLVFWSVFA